MDNDGTPPRLDSTVINRRFPKRVNTKVVVSGNLLQLYYFDESIVIENGAKNTRGRTGIVDRSSEYKARSLHKGRNIIRCLVQANFNAEAKFITLTFNDKNLFDTKSIKQCDEKFRLFIRRLKFKYPHFKEYLMVREFQNRGVVHYHIIANLPYIAKDDLAKMWGHGFVWINEITNVFGIGAYLSKYLTKDMIDIRFKGFKTYIASRNLKRPVVYYGEEAESMKNELVDKSDFPSYEGTYKSQCNGFVYFSEYNLTQLPARESKK